LAVPQRLGRLGAQQSSDISASFFFRERSFSLIYFAGMTHEAMEWTCSVRSIRATQTFDEAVARVPLAAPNLWRYSGN